jgi:hypothetical protein
VDTSRSNPKEKSKQHAATENKNASQFELRGILV